MMQGAVGEDLKSPQNELSGDVARKLNVLLTESDDENEFSNEGLVEEEKLEEIMQELYNEITTSSSNTSSPPRETLPSTSPSSSSSKLSLSSPPFFAVSDVKSESCGASVSDSSSTVMAGIEFVGPTGNLSDVKLGLPENELWAIGKGFDDKNRDNVGGEEAMEGCGEGEVGDDDQWLERVLGWGPVELDDWT